MTDNYAVALRWADRVLGKTTKANYSARNRNFYGDDNCLYSYGSHFPMVRVQRDKKGNPVELLRNGDRFSNTTSRHQSIERSVTNSMGLPVVTIPFSALNEAGILLDTVHQLDVSHDTTIKHHDVVYELPPRTKWHRDWKVDVRREKAWFDGQGNPWRDPFPNPYNLPSAYWKGLQASLLRKLWYAGKANALRGKHEEVTVEEQGHWGEWYLADSGSKWNRHSDWDAERDEAGTIVRYTRTRYQHVLGASLIEAVVVYPRTVRCATCRGTGGAPEPWHSDWEIRRHERDLANYEQHHEEWEARRLERVAEYEASGLDVPPWHRIPARPPTMPDAHRECPVCGGRRRLAAAPGRRKAKFLSGFDSNESRPSYFFCELPPRCKAVTVTEAYEALKPEAVKLAEQEGREVKRQGDVFAIPLANATTRGIKAQGAVITKGANLWGTNHRATEVAVLPDGTTLVRGTLRHAPDFRAPDHKRVTIGRTWAVAVKNTVPVAKRA